MLYVRDFVSGYHSNRNPLSQGRGVDSVISGTNRIHTERATWARRPGMTKWSTSSIGAGDTPIAIYDYFDNNTKRVIVDGLTVIKEFTPSSSSTVLAKTGSGNQTHFTDSDGTLYFGTNAVGGVLHKRIGGSAAKVWGISRPLTPASVAAVGAGVKIRIGWKYRYVYADSSDGHVSSASPASASTGTYASTTINVTVTGTNQPRADKIQIYRTRDGGDIYYYLTEINNPGATTVVYNDNTPDTGLNKLLPAPSETSNEPPPSTGVNDLVYHLGRVAGIFGESTVQLSAHLIDGFINGVPEECFPVKLTYRFTSASALVSLSQGLLVLTKNGEVYLLSGSSLNDFDPNKIFVGVPVLTKNCVANDGDVVFVYTSNREVRMLSENAGDVNISEQLSQEDLEDFDPANCYLTIHRDGNRSALYLSNGDNKIFRFGFNTQTWSPVWEVDGATITTRVVRSTQVAIGQTELLIGPKAGFSGFLWKLDYDTNMDDTITFSCSQTFGNHVIASPGELANLKFVTTEATDLPEVYIIMQEITDPVLLVQGEGVQNEPPNIDEPVSLSSKRHYPNKLSLNLAGRHCRIKLVWSSVNNTAELFAYGLVYGPGA